MIMQVFLVFALLISLVAVVFAVQNTTMVTISFLMWDLNNSLAVVILLTVVTGVLISILASLPSWIKNRVYMMNLRKKNKDLETKLSKQEEKYQAAEQEIATLKVQVAEAASTASAALSPSSSPAAEAAPSSTTSTATSTANSSEPADASLDDLFTEEQPAASSESTETAVKKSRFPGIDRILNR
jgi:uncharacterized integral membrane protein